MINRLRFVLTAMDESCVATTVLSLFFSSIEKSRKYNPDCVIFATLWRTTVIDLTRRFCHSSLNHRYGVTYRWCRGTGSEGTATALLHLNMMKITTWTWEARASCRYKTHGWKTSMKQRYAGTDVNNKRFSRVKITLQKFRCALYRLNMSNLTFASIITVKKNHYVGDQKQGLKYLM